MNDIKYIIPTITPKKHNDVFRANILQVFTLMSAALALTGVMAFCTGFDIFMNVMYLNNLSKYSFSPIALAVQLFPFAMALFLYCKTQTMSLQASVIIFWLYSILTGLWMGVLAFRYIGIDIAIPFFVISSAFGVITIYGYTTKANLSSLSIFLILSTVGILFSFVTNILTYGSAIRFLTSVCIVLVFTILTVYIIKKMRNTHSESLDQIYSMKAAASKALPFYIYFNNLFVIFCLLILTPYLLGFLILYRSIALLKKQNSAKGVI